MKMIVEYEVTNSFNNPIDMTYIYGIMNKVDSVRIGPVVARTIKVSITESEKTLDNQLKKWYIIYRKRGKIYGYKNYTERNA